jgi:mRNA interferase MazF
MKEAGQVVIFRFPQTDLEEGKFRPALLLGKLPGNYDDWLICMISSQTHRFLEGFDEIVKESDVDSFRDTYPAACGVIVLPYESPDPKKS